MRTLRLEPRKRLGTFRWILHCIWRHPVGTVIEVSILVDRCPCGYWWSG